MWVKTLLKALFVPPLMILIIGAPFDLIGLRPLGLFFAFVGIAAFFMSLGGVFKELPPELRHEHEAYRKATEGRRKAFW